MNRHGLKQAPFSVAIPSRAARTILALSFASILVGNSASAVDGTWTTNTDGSWSTLSNWNNSIFADGSGSTATFNIDITADRTVHLDAPHTLTNLTFGDTDTSSAGGWILDNNASGTNILTLAGTTPTITVGSLASGKNVTISAEIAGTAGLKKDGAGTLILSGVNTYSGTTVVNAGTLQLGDGTSTGNGSLLSTSTISVADVATFRYLRASDALGLGGTAGNFSAIQGTGTLSLASNASAQTWGACNFSNSFTGTIQVERGRLYGSFSGLKLGGATKVVIQNGAQLLTSSSATLTQALTLAGTGYGEGGQDSAFRMGGATTVNGAITLSADATIAANTTSTINGAIGESTTPAKLTVGTSGSTSTINLLGTGSYTGGTTLNFGTASFANGALGTTGAITMNGGTLQWNGTNTQDISSRLTLVSGKTATFDTNGNNVTLATGFGGSTTGALTKTGNGTLTLSGGNTYTGTTSVNAGTLLVNNTTGSGLGTGAVSLASGATLGGTGTIKPTGTNAFTINGILAPGTSIGNLTLDLTGTTGKVTLSGTASFKFELGTAGASIGAVSTGDLITLASDSVGDFTFANNTIDFSGGGQAGWYKLLDTSLNSTTWAGLTFDSTTGVISSGLTASNLASGLTSQLVVGTASNGGQLGDIYLQTVPEPGAFTALLGGAGVLLGLRRRRS